MDRTELNADYGYELITERNTDKNQNKSMSESLVTKNRKCRNMLHFAMENSEY